MVDKHFGSHLSGLSVIQKYFSDIFNAFDIPVEKNHRNSGIGRLADGGFSSCARCNDHTVNVMCKNSIHHAVKSLCTFIRAGEKYRIAITLGLVFNTSGDSGKEFIGYVIRNDGYGIGAAASE